jgi:hypothetical protein
MRCAGVRIDKRYDRGQQRWEYRARCLSMADGRHHWQGHWWPVRFDRTDEEATAKALAEYHAHQTLSQPRGYRADMVIYDEIADFS